VNYRITEVNGWIIVNPSGKGKNNEPSRVKYLLKRWLSQRPGNSRRADGKRAGDFLSEGSGAVARSAEQGERIAVKSNELPS